MANIIRKLLDIRINTLLLLARQRDKANNADAAVVIHHRGAKKGFLFTFIFIVTAFAKGVEAGMSDDFFGLCFNNVAKKPRV